jgi:hypothetical protein
LCGLDAFNFLYLMRFAVVRAFCLILSDSLSIEQDILLQSMMMSARSGGGVA